MSQNWQHLFYEWCISNNIHAKLLGDAAKNMRAYFEQEIAQNKVSIEDIFNNLQDTLKHCDEIDYKNNGVPFAYSFWHFLDRYYRFQLMYLELFKKELFPFNNKFLSVLDLGTGPAPSLFALLDLINQIKIFAKENNEVELLEISVRVEYVEQSEEFVKWVNNFIDFLETASNQSYAKYFSTDNILDILEYSSSLYYQDYQTHKVLTQRRVYNFVIISNFLTNIDVVNSFSEKLLIIFKYITNRGIISLAGARNISNKYKKVYDAVDDLLLNNKQYDNEKYKGGYKKIIIENDNEMNYVLDMESSAIINEFQLSIIKNFETLWPPLESPSKEVQKAIDGIKNNNIYSASWRFVPFKRYSRITNQYKEAIYRKEQLKLYFSQKFRSE